MGDWVLSKGDLCELTETGDGPHGKEGPSCVLTFRAGSVTQEHEYSTMYVRGKESARLRGCIEWTRMPHTAVGARHARVCEVEDSDTTRVMPLR